MQRSYWPRTDEWAERLASPNELELDKPCLIRNHSKEYRKLEYSPRRLSKNCDSLPKAIVNLRLRGIGKDISGLASLRLQREYHEDDMRHVEPTMCRINIHLCKGPEIPKLLTPASIFSAGFFVTQSPIDVIVTVERWDAVLIKKAAECPHSRFAISWSTTRSADNIRALEVTGWRLGHQDRELVAWLNDPHAPSRTNLEYIVDPIPDEPNFRETLNIAAQFACLTAPISVLRGLKGSGKSILMASLTRRLVGRGKRVLITTPHPHTLWSLLGYFEGLRCLVLTATANVPECYAKICDEYICGETIPVMTERKGRKEIGSLTGVPPIQDIVVPRYDPTRRSKLIMNAEVCFDTCLGVVEGIPPKFINDSPFDFVFVYNAEEGMELDAIVAGLRGRQTILLEDAFPYPLIERSSWSPASEQVRVSLGSRLVAECRTRGTGYVHVIRSHIYIQPSALEHLIETFGLRNYVTGGESNLLIPSLPSVAVLDVSQVSQDREMRLSHRPLTSRGQGLVSIAEALVIYEFLYSHLELIIRKHITIGIISVHQAQLDLITALLHSHLILSKYVEKYCIIGEPEVLSSSGPMDIMIISLVRSVCFDGIFFMPPCGLARALSLSRSHTLLVCDKNGIPKRHNVYTRFLESCERRTTIRTIWRNFVTPPNLIPELTFWAQMNPLEPVVVPNSFSVPNKGGMSELWMSPNRVLDVPITVQSNSDDLESTEVSSSELVNPKYELEEHQTLVCSNLSLFGLEPSVNTSGVERAINDWQTIFPPTNNAAVNLINLLSPSINQTVVGRVSPVEIPMIREVQNDKSFGEQKEIRSDLQRKGSAQGVQCPSASPESVPPGFMGPGDWRNPWVEVKRRPISRRSEDDNDESSNDENGGDPPEMPSIPHNQTPPDENRIHEGKGGSKTHRLSVGEEPCRKSVVGMDSAITTRTSLRNRKRREKRRQRLTESLRRISVISKTSGDCIAIRKKKKNQSSAQCSPNDQLRFPISDHSKVPPECSSTDHTGRASWTKSNDDLHYSSPVSLKKDSPAIGGVISPSHNTEPNVYIENVSGLRLSVDPSATAFKPSRCSPPRVISEQSPRPSGSPRLYPVGSFKVQVVDSRSSSVVFGPMIAHLRKEKEDDWEPLENVAQERPRRRPALRFTRPGLVRMSSHCQSDLKYLDTDHNEYQNREPFTARTSAGWSPQIPRQTDTIKMEHRNERLADYFDHQNNKSNQEVFDNKGFFVTSPGGVRGFASSAYHLGQFEKDRWVHESRKHDSNPSMNCERRGSLKGLSKQVSSDHGALSFPQDFHLHSPSKWAAPTEVESLRERALTVPDVTPQIRKIEDEKDPEIPKPAITHRNALSNDWFEEAMTVVKPRNDWKRSSISSDQRLKNRGSESGRIDWSRPSKYKPIGSRLKNAAGLDYDTLSSLTDL